MTANRSRVRLCCILSICRQRPYRQNLAASVNMRMLAATLVPCFFCRGFVSPCHGGLMAARSSDLGFLGGAGVVRALSAGGGRGGAGCASRPQTHLAASNNRRGGLLPLDKLLKQAQYEGMEKETAAKLLDGADSALRVWSTFKTGFLPPPDVAIMRKLLDPLLDVDISSWGGHDQAERQRLFISREGGGGDFVIEQEVEALEIGGQFLFDMANHRDFLGSILGTGITRGGIGDIIVQGERGAQVLVDPVMAEHLCQSLTSVRSVTVKVRRILMEELSVRPAKLKDVSTVEASLRLDSVASAGMGMSRSKMSAAIKSGLVLVNWKTATSGTSEVKEGDIITVRGSGRVTVVEITVTKKGRYKINMVRTK